MSKKTASPGDYDDYRDKQAKISRERSASGREIGAIPDIADVKRRARCRKSLRLFCETYNPAAFALGWSDEHLKAIARIEEAATRGALYAFAMARGSGKTTICRMAALWAMSYRHCRYAYVIGATDDKAKESLDTLRVLIRFLADYAADFPEISHPARQLAGIANRASGQTCDGASTLIEWAADRVVLPTVPPPANWPKAWPLRADGMVPSSGSLVSASGLTGEGIRGSLKTLTTGEMVRPDLVLLDDPQTPESARSVAQNATRLKLIESDVLGMAGPGATIAAVMPCTVIECGDCIDQLLDRAKHPLWRGERSGMLRSMPRNLAAWAGYFELYARCAQKEPPDFGESNVYYQAHREALDEGAEASWPARKGEHDLSAVQHAMHLYFRNPTSFMAEYQNDPLPADLGGAVEEMTADQIAAKLNHTPYGALPRDTTRVTCGVDVQARCLFWLLGAWGEDFGGSIVAYGAWPRQNRAYYSASDVRPDLAEMFPDLAESARLYAALGALIDELTAGTLVHGVNPERVLIDANWGASTDTVYQFCRQTRHKGIVLPSHGRGIGASGVPMRDWPRKPGERRGLDWVMPPPAQGRGRHVTFDANSWKTFVHERLRTPGGSPGCLWLSGDRPHTHQLLADHLTAEYRVRTSGRGREVDEWKIRPERSDNHWLDCLVLSAVAASVQGLAWSPAAAAGQPVAPQAAKKPVKWSEVRQARRG